MDPERATPRRGARARVALVALVCALGGSRAEPSQRTQVRLPAGVGIAADRVVVEPSRAVRSLYLDGARRTLTITSDGSDLTVRIDGVCPVHIAGGAAGAATFEARALFAFPETLAQVGYDAPVAVRVVPGCAEAAAGEVTWTQREGLPLGELEIAERGLYLRARTLPLARYRTLPLAPGIAPVSPRTQGRYVLEALARAEGHAPVRRMVTLTAIARATGMASLAVSQRVMIGGEALTVERAPRGARATVEVRDGVQTFAPDAPGRYVLARRDGTRLELTALTHETTPMDCARADCHVEASARTAVSPMSAAFTRGLMPGRHGSAATPDCALACHAVGEPGLDDGGFVSVAHARGFEPAGSVETMPHALQRLTGVRCTSCHGPSAIPDAQGRERILRADVCATCHDAPPAYVHVARWRESKMAQADVRADTRAAPCARCHTTAGFLDALGIRKAVTSDAAPDGIACAACHAPHGASLARLVRDVPAPATLEAASTAGTASALCSACHVPDPDAVVPAASSASLWLGRVRLPESLGEPREFTGPAPHGDVAGGCAGCHGLRVEGRMDHGFAPDPKRCAACHAALPTSRAAEIVGRARALIATLRRACGKGDVRAADGPAHAQADAVACGTRGPRARALYLALLVAEDGAAATHNAPFARALLEEAARLSMSP
ncbi:MAG: hypothetical protein ABW252_20585 [Polyangiales bacterium]